MVCPKNHSFDIARSGYINLLQPQDRRAKEPGDSAEAIAARRRLHDQGFTAHQRLAIAEAIAATPDDVGAAQQALSAIGTTRKHA